VDRDEIDKALANVAATLAVENLKQSSAGKEISTKYLEGKLTSRQAIGMIKKLYNCK
jgi:hypothetical protein